MEESKLKELKDKLKLIKEYAVKAKEASNLLPSTDYDLYQTYSGFSKVMSHESKTIIQLLNALTKDESIRKQKIIKAKSEENFDIIVEINDTILDRVGNLLDEAEGLKKKNEDLIIATLNIPSNKKLKTNIVKWNQKPFKPKDAEFNFRNQVLNKPQNDFKDKISNHGLFEPKLVFKHNSIKPLSIVKEVDEKGEMSFTHPYEVEIMNYKIDQKHFKICKPLKPASLEETYFKYIDTIEELNKLLEYLKTVDEFAVDLEYHSQRSFLGFTCLIQISSRNKDFIIDAIKLRNNIHILNEVFTDPKILKVFHGAELDIRWLQKDFGIYVVNLYDTHKASKILQFASLSLLFLVKYYCNHLLNKKFQLADWRIRPLPEVLIKYARLDTHFLLYIFDLTKNDLIKKDNGGLDLLKSVFELSRKVCLNKFEIPTFYENSYLALIIKNRNEFNNRQTQALKEIYSWRDETARKEDESLNYILPDHMMLKIAEILPQEQQGILACCNPVPNSVKKYLTELHLIVLKARELPLKTTNNLVYNLKPIVNNTVDITSKMDFIEDENDENVFYDCLLDNPSVFNKITISRNKVESNKDDLSEFLSKKVESQIDLKDFEKISPYQKYLKVIEEKKLNEQNINVEKEIEEIDIEQVPEISSKEITNEIEIDLKNNEEELTKKLDTCPLIGLNKNKKKKIKPDIPCTIDQSIDKLIDKAKGFSKEVKNNKEVEIILSGDESSKEEDKVDFDKSDYSIFSQDNNQSKYFDPSEGFMKQKQKNKGFNSRTKRKRDFYISSTNKKSK